MTAEEHPMSVALNPLIFHKRVAMCTASNTFGFTWYNLKCCDMNHSDPPSNSTFTYFPKDPPRNLLHFQQKLFPHKNQLKWYLQKHQLKCLPEKNQQKLHPPSHPKDQTTVTLIWLSMLSLLSVGKHCSSKTGKCFNFQQQLFVRLTKGKHKVQFKEFIFPWLQRKIFLSASIKVTLKHFTSPPGLGE